MNGRIGGILVFCKVNTTKRGRGGSSPLLGTIFKKASQSTGLFLWGLPRAESD
jgi:hypothetical protein